MACLLSLNIYFDRLFFSITLLRCYLISFILYFFSDSFIYYLSFLYCSNFCFSFSAICSNTFFLAIFSLFLFFRNYLYYLSNYSGDFSPNISFFIIYFDLWRGILLFLCSILTWCFAYYYSSSLYFDFRSRMLSLSFYMPAFKSFIFFSSGTLSYSKT